MLRCPSSEGQWFNHRECHVGGDFLLIYRIDDSLGPSGTVAVICTGTHNELFRSHRVENPCAGGLRFDRSRARPGGRLIRGRSTRTWCAITARIGEVQPRDAARVGCSSGAVLSELARRDRVGIQRTVAEDFGRALRDRHE